MGDDFQIENKTPARQCEMAYLTCHYIKDSRKELSHEKDLQQPRKNLLQGDSL